MVRILLCVAALAALLACARRAPSPIEHLSEPPASVAPEPAPRRSEIATIAVEHDQDAFVLRAATLEAHRSMVFIAGMCGHPLGYVQAFQDVAAAHGDLVAVQGDVSCGGDGALRRWSSDLETMNRRIGSAFVASGLGEPHDVVVIGYSQGAERAERLVERWPERYSRAILIASPVVPSPSRLGHARGVVLMAGTLDGAYGPMRGAVRALSRSAVPTTFLPLPGGHHGSLGDAPSASMSKALQFLD